MSLAYSCIARGNVILVDKQSSPGNLQLEARNILGDLVQTGNRKTTLPREE